MRVENVFLYFVSVSENEFLIDGSNQWEKKAS